MKDFFPESLGQKRGCAIIHRSAIFTQQNTVIISETRLGTNTYSPPTQTSTSTQNSCPDLPGHPTVWGGAFIFFKVLFIYFQREVKGRRKKGRGTSMCDLLLVCPLLGTWPTTQACALSGNQTGGPLVCRPELHQPGFGEVYLTATPNLA